MIFQNHFATAPLLLIDTAIKMNHMNDERFGLDHFATKTGGGRTDLFYE